jgi:hypothetical protein
MSKRTLLENAELAESFWSAVPQIRESKDIIRATPIVLPLAVVLLAPLTFDRIRVWFAERHAEAPVRPGAQHLRGMLLAARGHGVVFVDADDDPRQLRISVAHEVAHFLLHHQVPRQRTLRALGPSVQPVLDGLRAPSVAEQLAGALRGLDLASYSHLRPDALPIGAEAEREREADLLAFALLAPHSALALKSGAAALRVQLFEHFAFPDWAAHAYAEWLHAHLGNKSSVRDWFAPKSNFGRSGV